MKTFKEFIEEAYSITNLYEVTRTFGEIQADPARQNLEYAKDLNRQGRRTRLRTSSNRFNPNTRANVNLANLNDLMNKWNRSSALTDTSTSVGGATATRTNPMARSAFISAAAAPFIAGDITQRDQAAATRRMTGARPGELQGLNPSLTTGLQKKIISDPGGKGGKVSTNTAYNAILGKTNVTLTRGASGQRMVRADPRALGPAKPVPFSIFNPDTWTKPEVGRGYEATLGRRRGTVTYNAAGGRRFEARVK